MLKRLFTDHPASVDETYTEHMAMALGFAGPLFVAACAALVHAFLPFLFVTKGRDTIGDLHDRLVVNRRVQREGRLASLGND
jgi:hypothetical protein